MLQLLELLGVPQQFARLTLYGLIALLIVGLLLLGKCAYDRHEEKVFNSGSTSEQVKSQSETINAVQNAQIVVAHPTSDQLNIVCSKYDRNCPHGS